MACTHTRHKGFTLVELMVVIAIIGILAAIAAPRFQLHMISSRLENAKPYMASIAARLKETRNQYGSFLAGGESVYRGGGTFNNVAYSAQSEQMLIDVLGVKLKDAADFCFRVQLGTAASPDTGNKPTTALADGDFEVWAVLMDSTNVAAPEKQTITLTAGAPNGGNCITAGDGTGSNEKLAPSGAFSSDLKGTIVVFKYPPPPNGLYWTDGFRMDNPLGVPLADW